MMPFALVSRPVCVLFLKVIPAGCFYFCLKDKEEKPWAVCWHPQLSRVIGVEAVSRTPLCPLALFSFPPPWSFPSTVCAALGGLLCLKWSWLAYPREALLPLLCISFSDFFISKFLFVYLSSIILSRSCCKCPYFTYNNISWVSSCITCSSSALVSWLPSTLLSSFLVSCI